MIIHSSQLKWLPIDDESSSTAPTTRQLKWPWLSAKISLFFCLICSLVLVPKRAFLIAALWSFPFMSAKRFASDECVWLRDKRRPNCYCHRVSFTPIPCQVNFLLTLSPLLSPIVSDGTTIVKLCEASWCHWNAYLR